MCLARVWPEDWTGHALQRILTQYRWIANCGKGKASQVRLLIDFINHVLAENSNRTSLQPWSPFTKKNLNWQVSLVNSYQVEMASMRNT